MLLDIIILGLTTYRLASLFSEERGPYNVFGRIRSWAGEYYVYSDTEGKQRVAYTEFGRGLICLHCCSVWVGIGLAMAYYLYPGVVAWCLPLALSSLAMLISSYVNA